MFDHGKKIDTLERIAVDISKKLNVLEQKIDIRPNDYEKEAKQASKKTAEFRNKSEQRLDEANQIAESLTEIYEFVEQKKEQVVVSVKDIKKLLNESKDSNNESIESSDELHKIVEKFNAFFEDHPNFNNEFNSLNDNIIELKENSSKAKTTYKDILSKKLQIDEIYREIYGYSEENENNGDTIEIRGLKDELEESYNQVNNDLQVLKENIENIESISSLKVRNFIEKNQFKLDDFEKNFNDDYIEIHEKIKSLLPDAMTAGLSSAFVEKKKDEVVLYEEYKKNFNNGISLLSAVALFPIIVGIYFLSTGTDLATVIERSPKIVFSFMPLYIPLIWTTISANKKVNLSKRLIEEYSHKQVLSMTIEGLSNQINNLADNEISNELRTNLLKNFLIVTSENPGKLISNYKESDHPILNLLDKQKRNSKSDITESKDHNEEEILKDN